MEQTEHFYERQDRIKENGNFFRFTVSVSLLDLCLPILPLKRFQSEKNFRLFSCLSCCLTFEKRRTISKNILEKEEEKVFFPSCFFVFILLLLPTFIFIGLPKHISKLMKRAGWMPGFVARLVRHFHDPVFSPELLVSPHLRIDLPVKWATTT